MPKKPNPARIKRHQVYTPWEAAEALGLHRQTVIRWIKSGSLEADQSRRPWLIEGKYLKAFLEARRSNGKCKLKVGEIYCLPCRGPKLPFDRMVDFRMRTQKTGTLIGLCPDCGRLMHRALRRADLEAFRAVLDVTVQKAVARLVGPDDATETVTLERKGQTHGKAQTG